MAREEGEIGAEENVHFIKWVKHQIIDESCMSNCVYVGKGRPIVIRLSLLGDTERSKLGIIRSVVTEVRGDVGVAVRRPMC